MPVDLYERLGGAAGIRALVDAFYDAMERNPGATAVRALHPESLAGSRDKLAWFLTGWAGGPPEYVQRFGHPQLRARHLPFAIDSAARDAWLSCMREALEARGIDPPLAAAVLDQLSRVANHMRNTPDPERAP
jgi:hemoglobin